MISVFTHLDEDYQFRWLAELQRIAKPGALVVLTVNGAKNGQGFFFERSYEEGLFPAWYQNTYHSRDYVFENFGKYFEVLKTPAAQHERPSGRGCAAKAVSVSLSAPTVGASDFYQSGDKSPHSKEASDFHDRHDFYILSARMHTVRLPAEPLVVIQPTNRWSLLSFKDIWAYRELLFFLTWRDVKVRYKQTALGAAWAILQPLFMMIIFTIFFGRLAAVDSAGIPYPVFALAGLVPWTFFSNAITASGNSLVGSANLITKVYFPRLIVPAAAMLAGLVDFLLAFILLCLLMIYYQIVPTIQILFLPVLVLLTALFSLGVGTWFSALNVNIATCALPSRF